MPSEVIQKPVPPSTLDRFKVLVREREDELRDADGEDEVAILNTDDVVRIYEVFLSELTVNSKPLITELTMIAGDNKEHAEGIADAICTRIIEVPAEMKLPSLYLLDSIVKNIGSVYIRYFASRLPEVFVEAYRQVHQKQHPAMQHLFRTWSSVFPPAVLRKIGIELQLPPPVNHQSSGSTSLRSSESLSPRPIHGIHVNPKYLEARRQSEHATTINDFHNTKGVSSSLQRYGQRPSVGFGEYDVDNAEIISQQGGFQRRGSPGLPAHSSVTGLHGLITPNSRLLRPPSPSRIRLPESLLASDDINRIETSPGRAFDRASPLHSGLDYASERLSRRNGEWNGKQMKHIVDHTRPRVEPNSNIEFDRQRPRALIDAYGNYRGESKFNGKPLKIEPLDVNGINSDATTKTWQNTEEEEYVWEDMSPTLADRSRSDDIILPNLPLRNSSAREGFGRPSDSNTEPDYRAGYWPMKSQLPPVDNTSKFSGDGGLIPGSNLGDAGAKSFGGFRNQNSATQIQGPNYFRDPWNVHPHFSQSSQFHPKVSGNVSQISFPSTGPGLSGGQRVPPTMDNTDVLSSMPQTTVAEKHFGQNLHSPLMVSQGLPQTSQNQINSQFGLLDANRIHMNQSVKFDSFERKVGTVDQLSQLPNQLPSSLFSNNHSQGPVTPLQSQVPGSVAHENFGLPISAHIPSSIPPQPMSHGHSLHGPGALSNVMPLNRLPGLPPIQNTPFQVQNCAKPPLPPGPPPALQMGSPSQNMGPVASQLPGPLEVGNLFNSLMAQGLIKLPTPGSVQGTVGVEFDPDVLKVRHESSIKAMYADLSRQCKTCGLRFKLQDDHSAHMDWHVTKNRVSKNRKQKSSRKWFVNTSLWLSGAETMGSEAVPGFSSNETVVERNDDEVMAVPADENQSACALCGESFDNFYCDENEEWMYKGAVYMNAPDGSVSGMDISQLGPIVHAKCRSESTVVSSDDLGLNGGETTAEDNNHPKRMRV